MRRRGEGELQASSSAQTCDFGFWKIPGGRQLEPPRSTRCCATREVGPLDGFRSKMGRPFSAKLKLTDANEVEFDFGAATPMTTTARRSISRRRSRSARARSAATACSRRASYVCEHAVGAETTCDFRSGRMILQQPIEREQMEKLLDDRQDRSAAVRLGAHAPAVHGLPREAAGRQGRLRVRGEGARTQGRAARRAARRCACSARIRAIGSRSNCMRAATVRTSSTARPTRRCPTGTRSIRCRSTTRWRSSMKRPGRSPTRSTRRDGEARAHRAR